MEYCWINGQPARAIDVSDRGFTYGDGLFETIAIRHRRPRFVTQHLDRLYAGASRLRLAPPSRAPFSESLLNAATAVPHGNLKVILTRGPGPRGYALPLPATPTTVVTVNATAPGSPHPVHIRHCETMVSVNPATAGLKTLNRLEQVLARAEWTDSGVTEGLMTTTRGDVIGGTSSNLFLVMTDSLLTPAVTDAGIAGVMRRIVIEQARQIGLDVVETQVSPNQVRTASELFLTNALTGIRSVQRLDEQVWTHGPVTRRLCALLATAGVEECAANV